MQFYNMSYAVKVGAASTIFHLVLIGSSAFIAVHDNFVGGILLLMWGLSLELIALKIWLNQ